MPVPEPFRHRHLASAAEGGEGECRELAGTDSGSPLGAGGACCRSAKAGRGTGGTKLHTLLKGKLGWGPLCARALANERAPCWLAGPKCRRGEGGDLTSPTRETMEGAAAQARQ